MNREQINQLYASAPPYLWPWIWVQLLVILTRMELFAMKGHDVRVLIGVTHGFRLHILFQSDVLSGHEQPTSFSIESRMTFASLCEPLSAIWTPFQTTSAPADSTPAPALSTIFHQKEYAEALRPVP